MVRIAVRVVGALLALLGLALTVVGVWFATRLGASGTAEFETRPTAGRPVLLSPEVLNRVDADIVVTATPTDGGRVWMAKANPSDAQAVLGDAQHVEIVGVEVRDWVLRSAERGSAEPPSLGVADLWRAQDDAEGPVSLTVTQDQAPESVVIAVEEGSIQSLTLRVADKRWFVEAVVASLVGLFLVVAGIVALWPRRRHEQDPAHDDLSTADHQEVAP